MDFFTKEGAKILLLTFLGSFLFGGIVAIIGFTLIVDVLAK